MENGHVLSVWCLLFSDIMLKHVQICTKEKGCRINTDENWSVALSELKAFIAVLYARGVYGIRALDLDFLWNTT